MFSLVDEENSFPLSYHHSQSFTLQESNNNSLYPQQNHQQNLLHAPYHCLSSFLSPPISENHITNNVTMIPNSTNKVIFEAPIKDQEDTMINFPSQNTNRSSSKVKNPTTKKDRHTKISTAQGLRDRRVRLSISIARDFFSLQDMLGFDKASKTLGWLLANSKAAIEELATTLKKNNGEPQNRDAEAREYGEEGRKRVLSGKSSTKRKRGGKENNCKNGENNIGIREVMRAKARERARERTKKKKMTNDHNNLMMICPSSSSAPQNNSTTSINVGEALLIKSKSRGSSSHNNHNYDHIMSSKDKNQEGLSFYNDYLTRLSSENHNGILGQPGFSALNIINLSTEIRINARPWDTFSNQVLH